MSTKNNSPSGSIPVPIWRIYFFLLLLVSLGCLYLFIQGLTISTAPSSSISPGRITILILLSTFSVLALAMLLVTWIDKLNVRTSLDRISAFISKGRARCLITLICLFITLTAVHLFLLTPEIEEPFTRSILDRLYPVLLWFALASFLTLPIMVTAGDKKPLGEHFRENALFYISLLLLTSAFIAWEVIGRTILKSEIQLIGVNQLGAPLIETQVFLAWIVGMILLAFSVFLFEYKDRLGWLRTSKIRYFDILVFLLLYGITVFLWMRIPISPNWFVSEPRPPNFEFYPISDAIGYDATFQFLNIGEGFRFMGSPFLRRPMHALYISLLHIIGGEGYENIVSVQVLVLAVMPAVLYLLTTILHNRVSGVIAGVLLMLREANSIAISRSVTTSHAKLLMAELPAMLFVMLFVLFSTFWLKRIADKTVYPLLAGGMLAVSALIRFETIIFVFVIAILSIIAAKKMARRIWLAQTGLFFLGILIILAPWVYRNWTLTGKVFIDSPNFRFDVISLRFRPYEAETSVAEGAEKQPPGLEDAEVSKTSSTSGYISQVSSRAVEFIKKYPAQIASFVTVHYLNNQTQPVLYLPATIRIYDSTIQFYGHRSLEKFWDDCCTTQSYIRRLPFWHKWEGQIPAQSIIPVLISILFISAGISAAWKYGWIAGILPVLMGFIYFLGNAAFRISGGRYILPVDWISILYFSIGLAAFSSRCTLVVLNKSLPTNFENEVYASQESPQKARKLVYSPGFYLSLVILVLIGISLPLMEKVYPPRYTRSMSENMSEMFINSDLLDDNLQENLNQFLEGGGQILTGRALYPRLFPPDTGEPGNKDYYPSKPYPYLSFMLIGPEWKPVRIPLEKLEVDFPDGSDVLVLTCPDWDSNSLAAGIYNDSLELEGIVVSDPLPQELICPLPEPIP
ncbi:MAG: ArnT family glycosyltransferase [Anaerolineales bacterium]